MQVLETVGATYDPWPLRRQRAEELAARFAFAAQLLTFYGRLTEVQGRAFHRTRAARLSSDGVQAFVIEHVLPEVIDVTVAAGPRTLVDAVVARFASADLEAIVTGWLSGAPQGPYETYLARAATQPVLEALPDISFSNLSLPLVGRVGEEIARCPRCGGLPQLSYFAISGEALVSGPRYLVCAGCSHNWIFSRMTCAGCGEQSGKRLPIYQDNEHLPHMRVDGCETCHQYLLTIDLRKDPRAVPAVDELAGLPLDLYAKERGLTKITANLLGN